MAIQGVPEEWNIPAAFASVVDSVANYSPFGEFGNPEGTALGLGGTSIPGQIKPPTGSGTSYVMDPATGRLVLSDTGFQTWGGSGVTGFGTGTEGGTGKVVDEAVGINTRTGPKWEGTFNPNLIKFGDLATNEVMEDIGGGTLRPGYRDYTPEVADWVKAGGLGPGGTPPPPSPPLPPPSGPTNGSAVPSDPQVLPRDNYPVGYVGNEGEIPRPPTVGAGISYDRPTLYQSNLDLSDPYGAYRGYRASQFPGATGAGMLGPALGYGYQPARGGYLLAGTEGRPGAGTFGEYLRGPREDIGTTRSRFGSAADWLTGMGGQGMQSLETMPMSAQDFYNTQTGLFNKSNIIQSGLAALGAGAGYSGQLGNTLGTIYDRMQDIYGAGGAGRFADYIQSAYNTPSAQANPYENLNPYGPKFDTGRGM